MTAPNMYELFDIEKGKWLDYQYTLREVSEMLGVTVTALPAYVRSGNTVKGRYKVRRAGCEWETVNYLKADKWAAEWDEIRLKLLRSYKRGDHKGMHKLC